MKRKRVGYSSARKKKDNTIQWVDNVMASDRESSHCENLGENLNMGTNKLSQRDKGNHSTHTKPTIIIQCECR